MNWSDRTGKPPTQKQLREAARLAKIGTKTHLAIAMALRPSGITQSEVITLLGSPYRNKIRQLIAEKRVMALVLPDGSRGQRVRLFVLDNYP